MRARILVSSTALVSFLFAASLPVQEVFAQKGGVLSPSTEWAVTKFDNASGAYCAMARRYNRDTVMTIAQNGDAETSFALDFQRPLWRTGDTIGVTLDPGAGQQRLYDIQPVSGQAFVVRMGRDDSFFAALEKTGMLRVEVAGQSYHFSLSDFDAGQGRLDACVASMIMPAAGEEAGAPVSQVAVGGGDSYRQEINALRRQIADLTRKNEEAAKAAGGGGIPPVTADPALAEQLAGLQRQNGELLGKLEAAQANLKTFEALRQTGESDKKSLEALRAENDQLKSGLASLQQKSNAAPDEGRVSALQKEVDALKAENWKLGEALSGQAQSVKAGAETQAEADRLRAQNRDLAAQVEETRKRGEQEHQEKMAALEARNRELETSLEGKADNTKLLEDLRGKISAMESENHRLKGEASRLAEAKTREEAASMAGEESEARIASLLADTERLKGEIQDRDRRILEIGDAVSEAQSLRQEAEALRVRLAAAEEGEKVASGEAQDRLRVLEEENRALQAAVAMAEENADIVSQDAAELSALKEEVAALKAENAQMEKAVSEKDAPLAEMSGELEALRKENTKLQQDIEAKDRKIAEIEAAHRQLELAQAENAEKAAAAEADEAESQLTETIAALEIERDRARKDLAEAKALADKRSARISDLEKQVDSFTQKAPVIAEAPVPAKKPEIVERPVPADEHPEIKPVARKAEAVQDLVRESVLPLRKPEAVPEKASKIEPIVLAQAMEGDPPPAPEPDLADEAEALNEAQALEIAMRKNLVRSRPAAESRGGEPTSQPLAVRQSQDPYEGIEIEPPPQEALPAALIGRVDEPVRGAAQEIVREPVGDVRGAMEAAIPAGEIRQTEKSFAAVPSAETLSAPAREFSSSVAIPELLSGAGLAEPGEVERVEKASGEGRVAYQWRDESVYGTAEQRPMTASASFDDMVKEYLLRAQERCPGQFAVMPDDSTDSQSGRADSYEIACVGEGFSSGASLVFFDGGGTFTVVAHEAPTQDLGTAMGYRDRVKKTLTGS